MRVIWFTGLSGSGKSTLAKNLYIFLKKNYRVKWIDGDKVRIHNNNKNKFTKKEIVRNNLNIIKHIKSILLNYDYILVSVISPIAETRRHARLIFKDNYHEVFVSCTLKTLIARDTKGLYEKARKKIIKNLIGYNSNIKYQKTKYKKILINTEKYNLRKSIRIILSKIKKNG